MKNNINSLGFGNSGNQFSIIPNNVNLKNNINKDFINNINTLKQKKKNSSMNTINKNFEKQILELKERSNTNIKEEKTFNITNQFENNQFENNQFENNQFENNNQIENKINFNVDWNNVFTNVCKKKLYSIFYELKLLLNNIPIFNQLFICYIDEYCTKYLYKSNPNITTLRIRLNNMLSKNNSEQLNKALELVKILEFFAPTNNLVILLNSLQIKELQDNFLNSRQLYWPSGNDGITWLTQL